MPCSGCVVGGAAQVGDLDRRQRREAAVLVDPDVLIELRLPVVVHAPVVAEPAEQAVARGVVRGVVLRGPPRVLELVPAGRALEGVHQLAHPLRDGQVAGDPGIVDHRRVDRAAAQPLHVQHPDRGEPAAAPLGCVAEHGVGVHRRPSAHGGVERGAAGAAQPDRVELERPRRAEHEEGRPAIDPVEQIELEADIARHDRRHEVQPRHAVRIGDEVDAGDEHQQQRGRTERPAGEAAELTSGVGRERRRRMEVATDVVQRGAGGHGRPSASAAPCVRADRMSTTEPLSPDRLSGATPPG